MKIDKKVVIVLGAALLLTLVIIFSPSSSGDRKRLNLIEKEAKELEHAGITLEENEKQIEADDYSDKVRGGGFVELIEHYTSKINENPEDGDAYYKRALIYQSSRDYGKAAEDYTKAIEYKPNSANAYFNRGFVYDRDGLFDAALLDYQKAIDLKAESPKAYNNSGLIYLSRGNYDKAIDLFNKALEYKSNYGKAFYNLGTIYERKGKFEQALENYEKAIEFNNDLESSEEENQLNMIQNRYRRAVVLFKIRNLDQALEDVNYVIENSAPSSKIYKLRSEIYEKMDRVDDAVQDKDTAEKLQFDEVMQQ